MNASYLQLCLIVLVIYSSCNTPHFDNDTYTPFTITSISSQTDHMLFPEDVLRFGFNAEIADDFPNYIEIDCKNVNDEEVDCAPNIVAEKKTLSITALPAETEITVAFLSGFPSEDGRLLTHEYQYGITSQREEYHFSVGPALPRVINVVPDVPSATIALSFSDSVRVSDNKISPQPDKIIGEGKSLLLLYNLPQTEVVISDITTPIRPGTLSDIKITPKKQAPTCEPAKISITAEDKSISALISSNCLIAIQCEGEITICQNNRCTIEKTDLKPNSLYTVNITLFSIDGSTTKKLSVVTKPEQPHIIISEVMHSPQGEPEKNYEFVELYNPGNLPFDLSNCFIDDRNDGKGIDPLLSDNPVLQGGETAVIVGNESEISADNLLKVDDTTIADGGLTSTESVQIICDKNGLREIVAQYPSSRFGKDGYSVTITTDGQMCNSREIGGSPGIYEECE